MLKWTALVTLATLILYFFMMYRVGLFRGRTGIKAPATTGHPDFERAYRVQMNTLEWMPLFLPPLWLAAFFTSDLFAAAGGLVWIVGRAIYMQAYMADPAKRGLGFAIQAAAAIVLFLGSLVGVVRILIA